MIRTIGVVVNTSKIKAVKFGRDLLSELTRRGVAAQCGCDCQGMADSDLIIILGGDGTVLQAFQDYGFLQIPFLCINFGSSGFLSTIDPEQFIDYLPFTLEGNYRIVERSVMRVTILRKHREAEELYALNDLVVRSSHLHISRQLLKIDGKVICSYEGDGIIVATSTGSTGYALSAGGAIVEPDLRVFSIRSLFPRVKSLNSLILSMKHSLEIVCTDPRPYSKPFIDGLELAPLSHEDVIQVEEAELKARFVVLDGSRYFSLLSSQGG